MFKICGTLERRKPMQKKNISLKIDEELLNMIDEYAESRYMNRSQAIISMLSSTQIIVLQKGAEIISILHSISTMLTHSTALSDNDKNTLKGACEAIWQLLNSITQELPQTITVQTN